MRKARRKIKRKPRKQSKPRKKKNWLIKHLDSAPTNRWAKITTYCLMLFEFVFLIWWLQDLLLNWEDIVVKLKVLFHIF